MYSLTLEPGTPMERSASAGDLPTPDPDLAADMYLLAEDRMSERGFRHYEISNWSLPGLESRHNLTYWRNRPFLGVGPGAHSYLRGARFSILRSPREYTVRVPTSPPADLDADWPDLLRSIAIVDEVREIGPADEMAETMMMGLRLDIGISDRDFERRFGLSLPDAYGEIIAASEDDGLVEWVSGAEWVPKAEWVPGAVGSGNGARALRLTPRGRLLGNEVFSRFFADSVQ